MKKMSGEEKEILRRLLTLKTLRGRLDHELGLMEQDLSATQLSARKENAERIWGEFESMRLMMDYLTTHEEPPEALLQRFCQTAGLPERLLSGL